MKYKIGKILLVIILIFIILFSICPKAFATNGNEMSISSKEGIGNTIEIISGNTNSIKSESVADVVSYLLGQGIIVNSITNHKGVSVELTSTALIGTGYVLDTNNGNYSVIVYGDANGDGEADAGDMKIIIDDFLGIKQASPIAKIAVDVYKDGDLDAADLKQVLDSFLGNLTGSILKTTSAPNPTPTPDVSVTPTPTPTPTQTITDVTPKIKIEGETITLTPETAPDYYGKIVTNYGSQVEGLTWRLFYVDFEGKYEGYGNTSLNKKGRIYLKADPTEQGALSLETFENNENDIKEIEYACFYAKNKLFKKYCNGIATNKNNEKAAVWLINNYKWGEYTNYRHDSYAIETMGAPSLEMYADSYNQYHTRKGTEGFNALNPHVSTFVDVKGYSSIGIDSDLVYDEYGLYVRENQEWWLSSPSMYGKNKMCIVGRIDTNSSNPKLSWEDYTNQNIWFNPVVGIQDVDYVVELTNETEYVSPILPPSTYEISQDEIRSNPVKYYGKTVENYNCSKSDAVWRIFYVDTDGKYGPAGTVYLKADPVYETIDTLSSDNNQSALDKMKAMNPIWVRYDGIADKFNEYETLYLYDESKWLEYKDTEKAKSVMGSTGIEMFLDSYNQYYTYYTTFAEDYVDLYPAMGGDKGKYTGYLVMHNLRRYYEKVYNHNYLYDYHKSKKYVHQENAYNIMASPGYYYDDETDCTKICAYKEDWIGSISYNEDTCCICPVVALNDGVTLELEKK